MGGNRFGHKISQSLLNTTSDHSLERPYTTLSDAMNGMTDNDLDLEFKVKYGSFRYQNGNLEA